MSRSIRLAALTVAAALLSGCGGGGGAHTVPPSALGTIAPNAAIGPFSYGRKILAGAVPAGRAQLGTMKVDVMMRLANVAGLETYARQVSDPSSGLYRHFLAPTDLAARFGASQTDYNAAIAYFTSQGLSVTGWTQRFMLRVVGPQAKMEQAFGTTFQLYNTAAGQMYGPSTTPHFSRPLAVNSVSHLVYGKTFVKRNSKVIAPHGSIPGFEFGDPPQQLAAAFDYTGAYAAGFTGTNIKIGVIGTGPILAADYNAYKSLFSTGAPNTITQVDVGSAAAAQVGGSPTATPPPTTDFCSGNLPSCNPEDIEAQIDTQQTAGLAPSANVLFYLAYVPNETCAGTCAAEGPQIGISEVNDEVQQALNDNVADVLSLSYGEAEEYSDYVDNNGAYDPNGIEPTQFAAIAAEGVAVFVASGDSGAQGCARPYFGPAPGVTSPDTPCVSAPAVDQNVTSVGGITTPVDAAGRTIAPFTTWGVQTEDGYGGTGGGLSSVVPLPSYQHGTGITGSFRNVPDLALEADPTTGVSTAYETPYLDGGFTGTGGTSVAAPEAAAMWALVVDACNQTAACKARGSGPHPYRLGNAAPYLYTIYNNATQYQATFLDIVDGNNGVVPCLANPLPSPAPSPPPQGYVSPCPNPVPTPDPGFDAGPGYDHTTGIGVPFARHLIRAVVGV